MSEHPPTPPADCFVPVAVPWRVVRGQDCLRGEDGECYTVVRSGPVIGPTGVRGWGLTLACGTYRQLHTGDPDTDTAEVLLPVPLAVAHTVLRTELSARLVATRTDPAGGTDPDPPWRGEG